MKTHKILSVIYWASPLLKLLATTVDAVSDGYNERYVKDPGHSFIKITDKIVILISWVSAIAIIYPSILYYRKTYSDDWSISFLILFFPYFANVYITILLYANSVILSVYNKSRKNIIRKINERKGNW